jgi:hypothetical protein
MNQKGMGLGILGMVLSTKIHHVYQLFKSVMAAYFLVDGPTTSNVLLSLDKNFTRSSSSLFEATSGEAFGLWTIHM